MSAPNGPPHPLALLAALGLCLALSAPVLSWVATAWRQSPLDRQGPIWAVAAIALVAFAWRRRGAAGFGVGTALLAGGALLSIAGLVVDVNLLRALALIAMLLGVGALAGIRHRALFAVATLLAFATPTTTFLLGQTLHAATGLAHAHGALVKWPLAALALLPWGLTLRRRTP